MSRTRDASLGAVPDFKPEHHLKVTGKLRGIIESRLPVDVLIYFSTPLRGEIIRRHGLSREAMLQQLENYVTSIRTLLVARLMGPGFTFHRGFVVLSSMHATIGTIEGLRRVLADPDVIYVTGTEEHLGDAVGP